MHKLYGIEGVEKGYWENRHLLRRVYFSYEDALHYALEQGDKCPDWEYRVVDLECY